MRIIGICGISGSGKSYLLQRLKELIPSEISILSTDDYYKNKELQQKDENGIENFDLPSSIKMDQLLEDVESLRKGIPVIIKKYAFNLKDAKPIEITIEPRPILLIEGIFVLSNEKLKEYFVHTVFIKSDIHKVLEKRIVRDVAERGMIEAEVRYQWENHVLPGYENFVLPYETTVNTVVVNDHTSDDFVQQVYNEIK
mgnify:CR=1 FL=1